MPKPLDHDLSISCGKIFEDFALQISEGISPEIIRTK
jgi:hypothetical protein